MKYFIALSLVMSIFQTAVAQEQVPLDRDRLFINRHEATLVRTSDSPSKITIDMMVPMSEPICERRETRMVMRTSSFHCGSIVERRVIQDRECVARAPNGQCRTYRRIERVVSRQIPRTCLVPETYCTQYGSVTDYEKDTVKLQFKNASKLAEGEQELFLIRAQQKRFGSDSVEYTIETLEAQKEYEVKRGGIFNRGTYFINGK